MSSLQSTMASAVLEPILLLVKNKSKIQIHTWDSERAKIAEIKSDSFSDALEICEVALWEKFAVGKSSKNPILISQPTCVLGVSKSISKWAFNHDASDSENNAILLPIIDRTKALIRSHEVDGLWPT